MSRKFDRREVENFIFRMILGNVDLLIIRTNKKIEFRVI